MTNEIEIKPPATDTIVGMFYLHLSEQRECGCRSVLDAGRFLALAGGGCVVVEYMEDYDPDNPDPIYSVLWLRDYDLRLFISYGALAEAIDEVHRSRCERHMPNIVPADLP